MVDEPLSKNTDLNFSVALELIKFGYKLARAGWNGKDMFIYLVQGSEFVVNRPPLNAFYAEGTKVKYHAHIDMKTAQGYCVPWIASQADMLADDYYVVQDAA